MRHTRMAVAVGLCLAVLPLGGLGAQELTVERLLTQINDLLTTSSYRDHDDQLTVSRVALTRGGVLTVETTKTKGGNRVTNVLEVSVRNVDALRMRARQRGDHTALSLGAQGDVRATLKCATAGGTEHVWDLPAVSEIVVEFKPNVAVESELKTAFAQLIRLAKERLAVT